MNQKPVGYLYRSRVYLSGAMENVVDGQTWRNYAKGELRKLGIICFDPFDKPFCGSLPESNDTRSALKAKIAAGHYDEVHEWMRFVRNEDLRICDISDFALILINPTIPSWGTAEELFELNAEKKPIFVVVEGGKHLTPLWLLGTLPHHYFYDSVDGALDMIRRIDLGKKEIDSARWRLLKPEYR